LSTRRCAEYKANGRETSARSRSLYFVKEDEDRGEMREITYGESGSARTITIQVELEMEHSPESLKMFISSGWRGFEQKETPMR